MKCLKQAIALAAMTGTLCITGPAIAAEPGQPAAPAADAGMNAMRVVVDEETGEIRAPTEEELQALIEAEQAARQVQRAARSSARHAPEVLPAEKTVVRHANGMISVSLSQETLSALKVETDASGKTRLVHEGETLTTTTAQEK